MAKEIDARGLSCPQPVFLTLKAIEEGKFPIVVTVDNATAHSIAKRHIFPFELFISRPICATQPLRTTCENHLFSYYFAPMQSTFIARSSFRCLARLLHDKIASVVKNERQ